MELNPVISMLGRRLRLAVIGDGPSSFIGAMHRQAARLDDRVEIQTPHHSTWLDNTKAKLLLDWCPEYDMRKMVDFAFDYVRAETDPRKV